MSNSLHQPHLFKFSVITKNLGGYWTFGLRETIQKHWTEIEFDFVCTWPFGRWGKLVSLFVCFQFSFCLSSVGLFPSLPWKKDWLFVATKSILTFLFRFTREISVWKQTAVTSTWKIPASAGWSELFQVHTSFIVCARE